MKQMFISVFLSLFSNYCFSQTSPADVVAYNISVKMKDSLSLTDDQRQQVFQINLQINQQKSSIWRTYNNSDSMQLKLQLIENTRDSLYVPILNNYQYELYLLKKKNLVRAN